MKSTFKKLMIVGVVLACSLCTKGLTVKQGLKDNKQLAQSKFNLEAHNDNSNAYTITDIGATNLGSAGGVVTAQGLDALAEVGVQRDIFHDH